MAYCTQADLDAAVDSTTLMQLTDDEGAGSINTTRLQRAMDDATAEVDGHIRGRYSVPLATVPPFIRVLTVHLAIHALYARRGGAFGDLPPAVAQRYKSAQDALRAIREGKLDLGVEPPPARSAAIVADTDGPSRLFTHGTMGDF